MTTPHNPAPGIITGDFVPGTVDERGFFRISHDPRRTNRLDRGYFLDTAQSGASLIDGHGRTAAYFHAVAGVEVTDKSSVRLAEVVNGRIAGLSVEALRFRFQAASHGKNNLTRDPHDAYDGDLHAIVGSRIVPVTARGTGVIEIDSDGDTWQRVVLVATGADGIDQGHVGAFRYLCARPDMSDQDN